MNGFKQCAWVTHAMKEDDGEAALVLGRSLRLASTRGWLVAVVDDEEISENLKLQLETIFDFVFVLKNEERWLKWKKLISPNLIAKLYGLGLTSFEKCIILEPASIVLKNPDGVFTEIIEQKTEIRKNGVNVDLTNFNHPFLIKPCRETLKQFEEGLEQVIKGPVVKPWSIRSFFIQKDEEKGKEERFLQYFINQSTNTFFPMGSSPAFGTVNLMSKSINDFAYLEKISIVHFEDLRKYRNLVKNGQKMSKLKKLGQIEKNLYKFWTDLFIDQFPSTRSISTAPALLENTSNPEPIAVIGMSCRFPMANNLEEYWDLLKNGRNAVRSPPSYRWTKEDNQNFPPGFEKSQAGFLSVPVDQFDAKFFEVSPKEATCMDPQHRLLLELAWESFEDAGINPQELKGLQGGVFLGTWINRYKEYLHLDTSSPSIYSNYKGNCVTTGAARISNLLGWTGPCVGTESDCSAGLTSVHFACKSLNRGESQIALACAANLLLKPFILETLPSFLSPDFRCKAFDESANGFARAEGCAVILLKRYSDALRDKDNIWGVIKGTAVSHEGLTSSMATPTVDCQAQVLGLALKDSGVHPAEVSYLEAHGTGTFVGDPIEMAAISKIYGGKDTVKERRTPLIIGSVKTNIGHTEACSGIAGLMKIILSMKNELIPPHINFNKLNPKINLEEIKAKLPLEATPWPKIPGKPRLAGVSSFGIAGNTSHLIFEEAPLTLTQKRNELERPLHIMKISAKSEPALDALLEKYKDLLGSPSFLEEFKDIAYTANVGRADLNWRACVIAEDNNTAFELLQNGGIERNEINSSSNSDKICFLFTGHGSQYPGMARMVYESSPLFRLHFDFCHEWLQSRYNFSLQKVCFEELGTLPEDEIQRSLFGAIGIFVVEYCLMKLWLSWGVKPNFVLGHSLGEFCGAVCAGILDVEDALTLVAERSRLIHTLCHGKMLVIKADHQTVDKLQKEFFSNSETRLDYAAFNAEDQTVVAGNPETILGFQEFLKNSKGVKCTVLKSSHAFHSKDMDPILDDYGKIAGTIKFKEPSSDLVFVSGTVGKVLQKGSGFKVDAHYWTHHTREPVNFMEACKVITEDLGCSTFLEIGPHAILSALVMVNNKSGQNLTCLPSLRRNADDWKTLLSSLGKLYVENGIKIDWKGLDKDYQRKRIGSSLPTYPFQRSRFWPKQISSSSFHQNNSSNGHPLLGTKLPTPFTKQIVFQTQITTSKTLEYLKEHMIGERVVYPGAGYIEMLMASGASYLSGYPKQFQVPSRALQLKNLKIHAPLQLNDDENDNDVEGVSLQTTLERAEQEEDGFFTGIFRQEYEDENKWLKHASASFLPLSINDHFEESEADLKDLLQVYQKDSNLDFISSIKNTLESEIEPISALFKSHDKVGLQLGDKFQIFRKLWRCPESRQILTEVEAPEVTENEVEYLLHPILIDAMIQAAGFLNFGDLEDKPTPSKKPQLTIPIGCKRFVWLRHLKTKQCFILSPSSSSRSALLIDEMGTLVAVLYQLELAETNVETVKAILDARKKSLPQFYYMEWSKVEEEVTQKLNNEEDSKNWVVLSNDQDEHGAQLLTKLNEMGKYNVIIKNDIEDVDFGTTAGIIVTWGLTKTEHDQEKLAKPYFELIQTLLRISEKEIEVPQVILLTQGQLSVKDALCPNPSPSTLIGMTLTAVNEHKDLRLRVIDLDPHKELNSGLSEANFEIFKTRNSFLTAIRNGENFEPKLTLSNPIAQPPSLPLNSVHLFGDRSTYLITGGVGGIGFEVCKWMLKQGARYIVLVGRSDPSQAVSEVLDELRKQHNCTITFFRGDIGVWNDCKNIFEKISSEENSLPPLRGVMHAAGVLSDAMIQNLTWADFQKGFQSKVEGSWNLHELTKDLPLEHFVLFSSVASTLGIAGQATYVSGCTFQDTLAHYRKSQGLPATTINWGQWSIGMAKDMNLKLTLPFTTQQGINALEKILRENLNAVTVVNFKETFESAIEPHAYMKWVTDSKIFKQFSKPSANSTSNSSKFKVSSSKFWEEYDACNETLGKDNVAKKYVETMLRTVLHLSPQDSINESEDLSVMGVDSLLMIELIGLMQTACGKRVTLAQAAIKECKTLKELTARLVELIEEKRKALPA